MSTMVATIKKGLAYLFNAMQIQTCSYTSYLNGQGTFCTQAVYLRLGLWQEKEK